MDIKEENDKKRKAKWAAIGIPVNCISCKDTSYQKKIPYAYGDEDSTKVHAALEFMQPLRKDFKSTHIQSKSLNTGISY